MTHPNGATVNPPVAQFVLQRSYIQTLRWHTNPVLVFSQAGSEYTITAPFLPGYQAKVKMKDGFYNWNSGAWRLDQILDWCYEQYLPDPTEYPAFLIINAGRDTTFGEFVLEFVTFGGSTPRWDTLPPSPTGYWNAGIIPTF
jgi:hypothetical protein